MDYHDTLIGLTRIVIRFTPVKSCMRLVRCLIEPLSGPHSSFSVRISEVLSAVDGRVTPYEKTAFTPYIVAVDLFLAAVSTIITLIVFAVFAKHENFNGKTYKIKCMLFFILFAIGLLIVLFVGIRHIRRYNSLIDSIYADNDDKRLYGISTILLLMVLTGILSFVVNAVGRFVFLSSEIPFAVLACFFSGLLYLLCYRGFAQQFSFADIAREECEETIEETPQEGYSQLLQKIDDERLYLQPGLTLAELAQQLGTNRTMLSKLVNEETGMPFAEFINRKRIAYVRRLEKEHPELRKEDLAEQAGYTSMRSFYRNYHLYNDFTEE